MIKIDLESPQLKLISLFPIIRIVFAVVPLKLNSYLVNFNCLLASLYAFLINPKLLEDKIS